MTSLSGLFSLRDRVLRARRAAQARAWVVRLDAGDLTPRQGRAFQRWIARPGADQALRRAGGLWEDIDRLVAADRITASQIARRGAKRRSNAKIVGRASAAALALGGAVLLGPSLLLALEADARTGTGERREIALEDGSRIFLDSRSAVDIAYRGSERRVRLLEGRAIFSVARDPARPFVVAAGGGETRALGTEFEVDAAARATTVVGIEHRIEVRFADGARALGPGEAVRYGAGSGLETVAAADPNATSWRRGILVFESRTLAEIGDALAPYSDRSIWVVGDARQRRFSGVFQTDNPLAGLKAAADSARFRLSEWPGVLVISGR